ncbi:hypothetical protein ATY35_01660 [Vibrio cidicii]|jgi:hypothetical protein|uniref:Transposase n=1 Tax=Vibrio cidicii TaxID=1763883 RepID=A0ABR5W3V2_9VIBR|nr:hypothetical protein ATY35_01660 [Vibrio cidicii]MBG0756042.1 hypothetical protein [Vibrio cidicii]
MFFSTLFSFFGRMPHISGAYYRAKPLLGRGQKPCKALHMEMLSQLDGKKEKRRKLLLSPLELL